MTYTHSTMSVRCPNCSHQVDLPPGASGSDSSSTSASSTQHPDTLPRTYCHEKGGLRNSRRIPLNHPLGQSLNSALLSRSTSVNGDVYSVPNARDVSRSQGDVYTYPSSSQEDIYALPYKHQNRSRRVAKPTEQPSPPPRTATIQGNGRLSHNKTTPAHYLYQRSQSEYHDYAVPVRSDEYHTPFRETFKDSERDLYKEPISSGGSDPIEADCGDLYVRSLDGVTLRNVLERSRPRHRVQTHGPRTRSVGSTLGRGNSARKNGNISNATSHYDSGLYEDYDEVFLNDLACSQNSEAINSMSRTCSRNHSNNHVTVPPRGMVTTLSRVTPSGSHDLPFSVDAAILNPVLSHIDFWPKALYADEDADETMEFEEFDSLVERANRWTRESQQYDLISCETVDKKVRSVQEIYSASMDYRDDEHTKPVATHIKGLRLWYRQKTKFSRPTPSVISFFDTHPQLIKSSSKQPQFESLSDIIDRINTRIKDYPLQGEILSLESVCQKIPEHQWSISYTINTMCCQFPDEYHCHRVMFIRIFYIAGPTTYHNIGVKDFTPHVIDAGGIFHPAHYAPLFSLVSSARAWLSINRDIKLLSVQTLETQHRKKSENQGNRFNTDHMFEFKIDERFRAYFIRLAYTQPVKPSLALLSNPVTHLTCKTFQPLDKIDGQRENITEVLRRVEKFLKEMGSRPIYIETQTIPEWMTLREFDEQGDRTFFDGEWFFLSDKDGNPRGPYRHPLLYVIRIYYDGKFDDPQHTELPRIPVPAECCALM